LTNGKFYIGSAVKLKKRYGVHKSSLENRTHDNEYLTNAYYASGASNFVFECIDFVEKEKLIEREQYFIDTLKACDPIIGYNICPTAGSTLGLKRTQESKDKMSRFHGRKVYQWSEDEYLVKEYDSIGMAEKETGLSRDGIKRAALGYGKYKYAGFIWSYESIKSKTKGQSRERISESLKDRISEKNGTQVVQKDINGNFIAEYKNARFAQLQTNISANKIRVACRKGSICHGYKWEYLGEVKNGGRIGEKASRYGIKFTTDYLIEVSRKSGPVLQYDLNMNLIKEHHSLIEAHIYSGIDKKLIRTCCLYNKHSVRGFIFRSKELLGRKYKKLYRLDDDMNIVESFDSIYQACDKYKMLTASVYQSIRKRCKCNNFFWKTE
jgi:group I intron endonuclease